MSETIKLLFGVPQGSVLGPVLFNIYIRSLYNTVKELGFSIQGSAEDHQVYTSFPPDQQVDMLLIKIRECIMLIQKWMTSYCLQLNPSKTEIIILGPQRILNIISLHGIQLTDAVCIRFASSTKSLGIYIDQTLSFKEHIIKLRQDCFRLIRNICKVRFLFTEDQLKSIVNSLIVCKLDYCNGLFYGIDERWIEELQRIQNAAGKAVYGLYKHDHVGNTLKNLHWLPVMQRIEYKVLLIVFKCLNGMGPQYLSQMLNYGNYGHSVSLVEPFMNTTMGERAFQKCAPMLWNSMPSSIKESSTLQGFKTNLKTHLFGSAYNT